MEPRFPLPSHGNLVSPSVSGHVSFRPSCFQVVQFQVDPLTVRKPAHVPSGPTRVEKRRSMRFDKAFPVALRNDGLSEISAIARNVSTGGMMVEVRGTHCRLGHRCWSTFRCRIPMCA